MGIAANLINAQPVHMTLSPEFADLYESHYAAVYRTALRITGNPADAEDVLQTIFLRVLNQGGRLSSAHAPEAYFRRAAANASLDLLRRRVSHNEVQLDESIRGYICRKYGISERASPARHRQLSTLTTPPFFCCAMSRDYRMENWHELFGLEKNNIAVRLHRIRQTLQAEIER